MQKKFLATILSLALVSSMAASTFAAPVFNPGAETNETGATVIPYTTTAPTLDGVTSPEEWAGAISTTLTDANSSWKTTATTFNPPTYVSRALVKNTDPAYATFSYLWNEAGLFIKIDAVDPTPSWTMDYLSATNNGTDGIQIVLDPYCTNRGGDLSILTVSPFSSSGGNGNSTVCPEKDPKYPDKPFWTELWGFCNEWNSNQDLVNMASKVTRYDAANPANPNPKLDSNSTVVSNYTLELCITPQYFSYNGHFFDLASGTQLRMGNTIIDYFHKIAGNFTATQGTGTFLKLRNHYGDMTANADMANSTSYNTYVLGNPPKQGQTQEDLDAQAAMVKLIPTYQAKLALIQLPVNTARPEYTALIDALTAANALATSTTAVKADFDAALATLKTTYTALRTITTTGYLFQYEAEALCKEYYEAKELFTAESLAALTTVYNKILPIANNGTDTACQNCIADLKTAINNLVLTAEAQAAGWTSLEVVNTAIKAKEEIFGTITNTSLNVPFDVNLDIAYNGYAKRVLIPQNQGVAYNNYTQQLAAYNAAKKGIKSAAEYDALRNATELSWQALRADVNIGRIFQSNVADYVANLSTTTYTAESIAAAQAYANNISYYNVYVVGTDVDCQNAWNAIQALLITK